MVLKATSQTPNYTFSLAKIIEKVGLLAGVFNLAHGPSWSIGKSIHSHPEADMPSSTTSTAAGVRIYEVAASTVKHVCHELDDKSSFIIAEDVDLTETVVFGFEDIMINTGIEKAIKIANDNIYGLSSGFNVEDKLSALDIARRTRTGQYYLNGWSFSYEPPFSDYKQ